MAMPAKASASIPMVSKSNFIGKLLAQSYKTAGMACDIFKAGAKAPFIAASILNIRHYIFNRGGPVATLGLNGNIAYRIIAIRQGKHLFGIGKRFDNA